MNFDFPTLLVLACVVTGGIWLLDSLFLAGKRKQRAEEGIDAQAKEPLLVEYSRSFFPVILVVLVLRSFLFEPFRIPSGSMMPTLLVGDFILVNKFDYGIRLPVVNKKIIGIGEPSRGDVIVFRYPRDPKVDYIKRVVGIPGDEIHYQNKVLYINGQAMPQTPVGVYEGVGGGVRETGSLEAVESIGEVEHSILMHPLAPNLAPGCQVLWQGAITVPEGYYFVMGDNRDNSNDSRCWGLVPEENLVGRAVAIWMSWDSDRHGFPVAWERIGQGIE